MLEWKSEYAIGIELIDEQHIHLFEIANRVIEAMKESDFSDKREQIATIIGELKDYTIYHFTEEEKYMESIGYLELKEHHKEHTFFIGKLNEINLDSFRGKDAQNGNIEEQFVFLQRMLRMLLNWILKHVLEKDKLIGQKQ